MLVHEFIIVSEVPESIHYTDYCKAQMTLISDEFILKNHEPIQKIEMYCQNLHQKMMGIDYYGITILDCKMAEKLKAEIIRFCVPSENLTKLVDLLNQSILEKKYIIHFGI